MTELKIKQKDIHHDIVGDIGDFPKYTTQLMNLANQNAQGTRPKVVGKVSSLIRECHSKRYEDWVKWYVKRLPTAIDDATDRIYEMIFNLKIAMGKIDKGLIRQWVKDLVLTKTFVGLCFQESILKRIADIKQTHYRMATPLEESKGIDGCIGDLLVSVKPISYKSKKMLPESIKVKIIYYEKLKDGIKVSFDF